MRVSRKEMTNGRLSDKSLRLAGRELQDSGFVVLEQVVDRAKIAEVYRAYRARFDPYIQQPEQRTRIDAGHHYVPMFVPFEPPFSDEVICANPLAVQVMEAAMGEIVCSFYNSNTTLRGTEYQPIHIDMPSLLFSGLPVALPPWLIVVNFPLIDFTEANGATEIWPGTHLQTDEHDLAERCSAIPSVRPLVRAGDLVIRDLRTWHRGTPNHTDDVRTMLAIVYNRPWFHIPSGPIPIKRAVWDRLSAHTQQIFGMNTIID